LSRGTDRGVVRDRSGGAEGCAARATAPGQPVGRFRKRARRVRHL